MLIHFNPFVEGPGLSTGLPSIAINFLAWLGKLLTSLPATNGSTNNKNSLNDEIHFNPP
jgi:hypothetical protein